MRNRFVIGSLIALVAIAPSMGVTPLSTGFTYQGQLKENGVPANGVYDLQFTLFDASTGGAAVTPTVCVEDVPVVDGLFTIEVPLALPPSGAASYLEVQVRPGAAGTCPSAAGFVVLDPRQKITPVPIATFASAVTSNPPAVRGAIRLNSANGQFEGFNGAFWAPLTTGTPIMPGNIQEFTMPGIHTFIVPEGLFALGVDVWSAGGGGGGSSDSHAADECGDTSGGGGAGGGGSGAFVRAVIDVFPGEALRLTVGIGGAAGNPASDGRSGGSSRVLRVSNGLLLVEAFPGLGGARGVEQMPISITLSCVVVVSPARAGVGGFPGEPQAPLGLLLAMQSGNIGHAGRGPMCDTSLNPDEFCPATGGLGGETISIPTLVPLPPGGTAGAGGGGAAPGGAAGAGNPGRIRLFWD